MALRLEGSFLVLGAADAALLDAVVVRGQRLSLRGQHPRLDELLYELHELRRKHEEAVRKRRAGALPGSGDGGGAAGASSPPMGVAAVAELVGCTDRAVRAAAEAGRLVGVKAHGRWLFERGDVEAWARARARVS